MKLNTRGVPERTHEGGRADRITAEQQLRRSVLTCLLWEDTFYEEGEKIAARITRLAKQVEPEKVAALAIEAREQMHLRQVPLLLTRVLAQRRGCGRLVAETLARVIQRADELTEFLAIYWKDGKVPLSAGVKKGLAEAFGKFDAYQLAKYNREGKVRLRDVMFLTHPKPRSPQQATVWKALADGTLAPPDTWEIALSAGADKRETFERLLREGKLGGMACLRNLRGMLEAGVDQHLIQQRLKAGIARALPFRFVTAARYAPLLEAALEEAMLAGLQGSEKLPGSTGLLVDVSGSMAVPLTVRAAETTRIDVAVGLAILLREVAEELKLATFSERCVQLPPRRGFALRRLIWESQPNSSTYLGKALLALKDTAWANLDRIIVITDAQIHDAIIRAWAPRSWVINVAPYQKGVGYCNGWRNIDGWSERVIDYIREAEKD